jgi:hypothetical protein
MPVEPDLTFALAATDQQIETMHRGIELQRLHPFGADLQGIVVAQIVELGPVERSVRCSPGAANAGGPAGGTYPSGEWSPDHATSGADPSANL